MTLDLLRVASGLAIEAGWATAHLMMYPLGLFSASSPIVGVAAATISEASVPSNADFSITASRRPRHRSCWCTGSSTTTPIFTVMDRALRRRGFQTLATYDYGLLTQNIPRAALRLGEAIEQLSAATGYERIHVIGHSLGGLIARYFVQRLGGDSQVHTLVTLGTPHQGTQLAWAAPLLPLVRQLTPDRR